MTFGVITVSYFVLSMALPDTKGVAIIYLNFVVTLFAIFALRGIYFALLQETRTPRSITGAAVGMISVVGFTPEIFFSPIAGRILDATPGAGGFHNLFLTLAGITAAGVAVVAVLIRLKRNNRGYEPVS